MNSGPTQRFSSSPLAMLVTGAVVGGLAWYLFQPKAGAPYTPTMIAYFDKGTVNTINQTAGSEGARFYFAADAPGDQRAIMAPIDASGRHVPENGSTKFRKYKMLMGSRADVDILGEPAAETLVKRSTYEDGPPWSIDCPKQELANLVGVSGCNGIGLSVMGMTDGTHTFQLIPVKIANGSATIVSGANMITAAPCPNFCAWEAAVYLHLRP